MPYSRSQRNLATEIVREEIKRQERIVGFLMKKTKVKFLDPTKANIIIKATELGTGLIDINYFYRDGLRFTDMGGGRGYHKGVRISRGEYIYGYTSKRKRKRILLRPIYKGLTRLLNIVSGELLETAELDFHTSLP